MVLHYNPVEYEIKKIKFSLFSPEVLLNMSVGEITIPDTYEDGYPIDNGLMDQRMGVIDPGLRCKTCGGTETQCPGHFGHIKLVRPVIHVNFGKYIYEILVRTCENCHKVVTKDVKKRPKKCPECKANLAKIEFVKPTTFVFDGKEKLPNYIRDLLSSISDEELKKLGYSPTTARPEWMVLTVLPVPPVNLRPSITLESGEKSEDDLTHKLVDIIRVNQKLKANIEAGAPQLIVEDLWSLLQYHVSTYFDNETSNIPPARHRSGRPLKTLAQRLKGKEGRFRYNLSGKRVNFSARTVVSPDPVISINEVGVPYEVAEELTLPIPVTQWNISKIKEWIENDKYPRAVYVIRADGRRVKVTETSKKKILEDLKVGWIVERQLIDGDVVLFNRQPSLHRISMMAHRVKVLPGRTFRINPIVTPPYNADFDGDEMNLHALQLEEARVEAEEIMLVEKQVLSPRHGHAIIAPQEDIVSGVFFLTSDETVLNKRDAAKLLYSAGIKKLPKPDLGENYSGKLLFSQLLPSELSLRYVSKLGSTVVIKKGKLIEGEIDSRGIEKEILEKVFSMKGSEYTRKFLEAVISMSLAYLSMRGLSVSLRDYRLKEEHNKKVKELLEKMDKEIESLIIKYKNKTLQRAPGMSLKETLESLIMGITSKTRDAMGEIVIESLTKKSPSIIMAKIGARGSILNAIQMSAVVGQQAIRNKRPWRGYYGRTLVYYEPKKLTGRERGFVYANFSDGLPPDEFYHHAMAGRESIVNTAIRTARSGYMQRRLIHALQDLIVLEDLTVRDASGKIIQTIYGGDGRDPTFAKSKESFEVKPKEDDVDTV